MATSSLDDSERLALLDALQLRRPQEDPAFDRVTRMAAKATGRPTALLTFLGPEGQWVAARKGWEQPFHPLSESFCLHTVLGGQFIEVRDSTSDPRFADNALVTGQVAVRFYAGCPLRFGRHVLGALCVLDRGPGQLTASEAAALQDLADMVCDLLQVRLERSRAEEERLRSDSLVEALRQSEAISRQSEDRYRLLWRTTTDAVLIMDEASQIKFANPATVDVFGYHPSEVIGEHLSKLIPERLRAAHARGFEAYLKTGRRRLNWRATQTVGLKADGTEVPIEIAFSEMVSDQGRLFAGFIRDTSERHRTETALRHREAQFRALTALSADWYWEVDADFRFTVLSEGAQRSGMLVPQEALGKRPWEARPGADDAHWELQRERARRREPFRDFEFAQVAPDGSVEVLRISGEPVFDEHGAYAGYRGVGRNVTAERRAEAVRRAMEERLRESQKLEAIGVLAGGIAHDFNNVIAGILGNARLALDDLEAGHPATASVQQIRKAGLRGREMVQQILTFARRRPKRTSECDLRDLVDETLGLLRASVPASVRLDASLPNRPLAINADPTQIEQVLINLCANAWQAMAGRPGHIEIAASLVEMGAPGAGTSISGLRPGLYAHLTVHDDGPGMDEQTAKRVFEPFFTTKAEGEGTGLGLSVVHGIVSGHGGAVTVDSRAGVGTTFHVWLPAERGDVVTAPIPLEQLVPSGNGRRVWYVDDDEVLCLMVARILVRCGYAVTTFAGGSEALEALQHSPEPTDILVTDLNMPVLTGIELARQVHLLRPTLPIIIGSGNLPQDLMQDLEQAGVCGTFHKQNALEELPALVASVLGLGRDAVLPF